MCLFLLCLLLWLPLSAGAAPPIPPPPPPVAANVQIPMPVVTPKMQRYSQTGYALYFVATVYELLALWGVLASGLSARLRDVAERAFRVKFFRLLTYYALLTLALAALQAPLTLFRGFWRPHAYGLSHQSFLSWLGDEGKSLGVDIVLNGLLLALLFWLIGRSPRRWALWLWGALIPLIAFGIFLAPLVLDPIFNKFTPMPPSPLRTQIHNLAARAGIPDAPIFIVDKSRQTETTNAYVTGIGSSARIVLWDTTLKRMPPDQTLAVVGHEMGHYVLKHLYLGFAESVLGLLIALPLVQLFVRWLVQRFGPRWKIHGLTDIAAVPVFLLALALFGFVSAPVVNVLSRKIEHDADAYGIAVTQDRAVMARAFVSLAEQNLSDPNPPPFITFWLFSHPPLGERIEFALGRKTTSGR